MRGEIRERAATLSGAKMSTRKKGQDKDKDKEEGKEKPDWVDTLEKWLVSAMENQCDILLKRMADMEAKMNEKIEGIKM